MNDLLGILKDARKHLMKGVSHMIPFVVAGGVLFAAAVIINGEGAVPDTGFAADLWALGAAAMGFMHRSWIFGRHRGRLYRRCDMLLSEEDQTAEIA